MTIPSKLLGTVGACEVGTINLSPGAIKVRLKISIATLLLGVRHDITYT